MQAGAALESMPPDGAFVSEQTRNCRRLARSERFERPTPRFVVWCSIQLSYERAPPRPAGRGT